ncbi:IS5 family transposase [Alkalibacter rhizosphaerae]|uniref:IS5 family transposase n=1 Tax=Alkalibacter rhizosphaerae TaxID=2815577 RepID=A0A974XGC9_9FIRM|nr:IS5 family transposase [Alkalibacter rhizosphaerae]QSX09266.1 IS5 family transposase [Alkalibacter rhizosphaerae]
MYIRKTNQIKFSDDFFLPFGGTLNKNNRWVILADLIPWSDFEDAYAKNFKPSNKGEEALSVRVALGTLILQTKMKLVDAEVPLQVMENPYLQYFLGYDSFEDDKPPFDSSLITHFRKRFKPDILMEINNIIAMKELETIADKNKEDDSDNNNGSGPTQPPNEDVQISFDDIPKRGKLILDATCAPSDIRFPTDLRLLNEAREKLEEMIDVLHAPDISVLPKPRTYRNRARKDYLSLEKQRKKRSKAIRKAIRKQLGYVKRDLEYVRSYLEDPTRAELLTKRQSDQLGTIEKLYGQQQYMYDERTHSVEERIVSISQPYIRPIVRGKAGSDVEFGCKVMTSVVDGYTFVEKLDFDTFNEGILLQEAVEQYRRRFGCYPEAVLADSIFRNRKNLAWLKLRGIRISGPRLGRKPKVVSPEVKKIQKADNGERNAVEGSYGVGKRKYGLGLIKTKLEDTTKSVIILQFLVMNLDRRLRSLLSQFWIRFICDIKAKNLVAANSL